MTTTSEMRGLLAESGLSAAEIDNAIAKAVTAGRVEDDSVSTDDILWKAQAALDAEDAAEGEVDDDVSALFDDIDGDAMQKGMLDMQAVAVTLAEGTDRIAERVIRGNAALHGMAKAQSEAVQTLAKSHVDLLGRVASLEAALGDRLDAISKALSVPVPPRAVSGSLEVAPSPFDAPTGGSEMTADEACNHLLALQKAEPIGSPKRTSLAHAISAIQTATPPADVFRTYGIALPSTHA